MSQTETHHPMSVMFTAKDVAKSLAFYRDQLGFKVEASWPDEKKPMWANVLLDGQSIMFGAAMPPEAMNGEACGHMDPATKQVMIERAKDYTKHKPGVGMMVYVQVKDVDQYHGTLAKKGLKPTPPISQFYGIRDFCVADPDGYLLVFYSPIKLESCQSCGMPMKDAKPGKMYCEYCSDDHDRLKPYAQIFEGTVTGYFMGMMKMDRKSAEKAATEHLAKMPAWMGRK